MPKRSRGCIVAIFRGPAVPRVCLTVPAGARCEGGVSSNSIAARSRSLSCASPRADHSRRSRRSVDWMWIGPLARGRERGYAVNRDFRPLTADNIANLIHGNRGNPGQEFRMRSQLVPVNEGAQESLLHDLPGVIRHPRLGANELPYRCQVRRE